jgi:hypothetical protein
VVTKISGAMIADSAVAHVNMVNNSVGHDEMRNDAIGTNELQDAAVTAVKLAAALDLSSKTLTLSAAQKAADYIEIRDEKASGTDGGGFTSGAWQKRDLNTEHSDVGGHASIATSQITLAAGTYLAEIACPAIAVNAHQARLYNTSDAATTLVGTSSYCGNGSTQATVSTITGRFTIASSKVFEVQHRCETTKATNGYGDANSFGEVEVYTVARFWKVG